MEITKEEKESILNKLRVSYLGCLRDKVKANVMYARMMEYAGVTESQVRHFIKWG
jgi:uncharacterized protein YnzC (UPF0291/DUF896 family)